MPESHLQYRSRKMRLAIEAAKVAIIDAQELIPTLPKSAADYQALTDAAFQRLDKAWAIAFKAEMAEQEVVLDA